MSAPTTPLGGILCFPALFKPKAATEQAEPRYSCMLIFPPALHETPEYKQLRAEIAKAGREKWGDRFDTMSRNGELNLALKPCTHKGKHEKYKGFDIPGATFVGPWSKNRPYVVDAQLNDIHESEANEKAYPGCLARVTYRAFAYDTSGNKGVALALDNVQITDATGERLDGKVHAKSQFGALAPTGGGSAPEMADDDLPF